jgi:hypothetical protein
MSSPEQNNRSKRDIFINGNSAGHLLDFCSSREQFSDCAHSV